jgi:deoxyribose-phosphate aldolase
MRTRQEIAATIDHAALKAELTDKDIREAAELGKKFRTASVCIRPSDVALVAEILEGTGVKTCMVVGFPHGASRPEVKALEARLGIQDGAAELDMVMNVGKFLSGDYQWVRRDIEAVVAEAKKFPGVLVKVILETGYLSPEGVAKACQIARDAGADFVKTSTGFGAGSATPEVIDIMVKTVGQVMGVKASGGVRDYRSACVFLDRGCTRLGTAGGTAVIMGEAPEDNAGTY